MTCQSVRVVGVDVRSVVAVVLKKGEVMEEAVLRPKEYILEGIEVVKAFYMKSLIPFV